jgi:hypothetical protein
MLPCYLHAQSCHEISSDIISFDNFEGQLKIELFLHWFIIRVSYYDIMVCRWFVVVWDDTIQDLLIILKPSKLIDSNCKDESHTLEG